MSPRNFFYLILFAASALHAAKDPRVMRAAVQAIGEGFDAKRTLWVSLDGRGPQLISQRILSSGRQPEVSYYWTRCRGRDCTTEKFHSYAHPGPLNDSLPFDVEAVPSRHGAPYLLVAQDWEAAVSRAVVFRYGKGALRRAGSFPYRFAFPGRPQPFKGFAFELKQRDGLRIISWERAPCPGRWYYAWHQAWDCGSYTSEEYAFSAKRGLLEKRSGAAISPFEFLGWVGWKSSEFLVPNLAAYQGRKLKRPPKGGTKADRLALLKEALRWNIEQNVSCGLAVPKKIRSTAPTEAALWKSLNRLWDDRKKGYARWQKEEKMRRFAQALAAEEIGVKEMGRKELGLEF